MNRQRTRERRRGAPPLASRGPLRPKISGPLPAVGEPAWRCPLAAVGLNCSAESGNRRLITPAGSERDPRGVPGSRGGPLARPRSPLRTATAGTARLPAEAERQLAARPRQVPRTSLGGRDASALRTGRVQQVSAWKIPGGHPELAAVNVIESLRVDLNVRIFFKVTFKRPTERLILPH